MTANGTNKSKDKPKEHHRNEERNNEELPENSHGTKTFLQISIIDGSQDSGLPTHHQLWLPTPIFAHVLGGTSGTHNQHSIAWSIIGPSYLVLKPPQPNVR